MSRIRTIKPEFYKHEGLFDAEIECKMPLRVAFSGLWTCADREGRFEWRPRTLKSDILPYDNVDFSRVLDALLTRGFLVKYEVSGKFYGYIPSWHEHQFINNKEKPSILPEPSPESAPEVKKTNEINSELTRQARDEDAFQSFLGKVKEEGEGERKGKGRGKHTCSNFEKFWATYPKKVGKAKSLEIWKRDALDEIFEVIVAAVENKKNIEGIEIQFWKDPERYLKYRRWEDAIVPKSTAPIVNGGVRTDRTIAEIRADEEREERRKLETKQGVD